MHVKDQVYEQDFRILLDLFSVMHKTRPLQNPNGSHSPRSTIFSTTSMLFHYCVFIYRSDADSADIFQGLYRQKIPIFWMQGRSFQFAKRGGSRVLHIFTLFFFIKTGEKALLEFNILGSVWDFSRALISAKVSVEIDRKERLHMTVDIKARNSWIVLGLNWTYESSHKTY